MEKKKRTQDIKPINNFYFLTLEANLIFRLSRIACLHSRTINYPISNDQSFSILISLPNGIYNTWAFYTKFK